MDIDSYVGQLTTAQKVQLAHGKGDWHTQSINGLPSVMMTDGPHGLRKQSAASNVLNDSSPATCFPTASAVASSWNRDVAAAVGDAIAAEAIEQGVSIVLGPGVNIKRSTLCGRNFEYFSEDPLLAGELASSYINGMQSRGVGCCVKHFAVNSQETNRMTVNSVVDERALREIYLAVFERVVKRSHPYAVMAAYNKVNGTSCTENSTLLTDILRREWGFDGLVMSDWGSCYDMAKSYSAGMDLEMPDGGRYHEQKTLAALEKGTLHIEDLDRAVTNVVKLADKCSGPKEPVAVDRAKQHLLCRKLAADCAVLLKNDGILPLCKNRRILVVGEFADKPRFQGAGSSHVNAECRSFLDVLRENGIAFDYARGYTAEGATNEQLEFEAAKLALKADTVLFFGGWTDVEECEGYDRTRLDISDGQLNVLNVVTQHNPNVVFVACGGAPFVTPWLHQVKALLQMHLGGEAVTEAAYDLLFGEVSPSGRLAESYPLRIEDVPCYNYFAKQGDTAEYRESIYVGYRYYNTYDVPVQFPFGFGLSYSVFDYSDMRIAVTERGVDVTVHVKNIGTVTAGEVVQVYVDGCDCGLLRAKRQLGGFTKLYLRSGAGADVTVHLDERAFQLYTKGAFRTVRGKYKIAVCKDVEHVILSGSVELVGEHVKGSDRKNYPTYYERRTQTKKVAAVEERTPWTVDEEQFYALAGTAKGENLPTQGEFTLLDTLGRMAPSSALIRMIMRRVRREAIRRAPTKRADDPVAKMNYVTAVNLPLISLMSTGKVSPKLVMFMLHIANKRRFKAFAALCGKYDIQ